MRKIRNVDVRANASSDNHLSPKEAAATLGIHISALDRLVGDKAFPKALPRKDVLAYRARMVAEGDEARVEV